MNNNKKLSQEQKQQEELSAGQYQATRSAKEFKSAEDLLRFDAAQIQVPPTIAERLRKSSAGMHPQSTHHWWQRLFGR
jgi:NADH dehydrogenase/NADH:ubiquinone oxidoreductase subunit G